MQDTDLDRELDDVEHQQVNRALQAILATEKFEAAPQMSAFLRYVVEQASAGNQSRIKAFTVAVDALGKPETFDPQNDPVVRVLAGRLRATLAAYNDEHPNAPVKITMTKGSYVPEFERQQSVADHPGRGEGPDAADGNIEKLNASGSELLCMQPTGLDKALSHDDTGLLQTRATSSHPSRESLAFAESTGADKTAALGKKNDQSGIRVDASTISRIAQAVDVIPKHLYIAMLLAVITGTALTSIANGRGEPQMQSTVDSAVLAADRDRPDGPSVFISAIDQGDPLENTLNTLVSSVISEDTDVGVYRILDQNQNFQYWPEDYVLELATLKMGSETRINLQLIEALTGRIIHSEVMDLNAKGSDQFSSDELTTLIEATRSMIIEKGPMLQHYSQRTASK
ncbi:hypothetical protein OAM69_01755 [bacterium]|nr:hypothetical protein [bacterium]